MVCDAVKLFGCGSVYFGEVNLQTPSWRTSVSWCGHPEKHPPKIVNISNTDDFQQKIILLSPCHHEKAEGFCGDPELLRQKCLFFWIATLATQVCYDGRIAKNHRC